MSDAHVHPVVAGSGGATPGGGAPPPRPPVPAWRLIATLGVAGTIAGLLIVVVFRWAEPRILAHQAAVLEGAVSEVLGDPARTQRLFVYDGALVEELPAGTDSAGVERVFLGFDSAEGPVGFAVSGAQAGFQDLIHVLFGYDPRSQRVLGMLVLDHRETPGLGDKIVRDEAFVGGFRGALTPLVGVKPGTAKGEREVDMITGVTISARTIIETINRRVERLHPLLEAHLSGRAP
jgi:Na+-translocating ferredoxin:NAD+ oxidoreductase subunit G